MFGRLIKMLKRRRVVIAVAMLACAALFIVKLRPGMDTGKAASDISSQSKREPGVFRPTAVQRAGLTVQPVQQRAFRTRVITDGRITADDDRSTPIFVVGDLSTVRLIANVREAAPPKAEVGQATEFKVLSYPDRGVTARIGYVTPAVDPLTRRVQVRANVESPGAQPQPDMLANIDIVTLITAAVLLAVGAFTVRTLGLELLPKREEGNLWIRATMPASISLEPGNDYVNRMRKVIGSYPEVITVISQQERLDAATDATGFFNAEFFVPLTPRDEWPKGIDKDTLTKDLSDKLKAEFPGVEFNFSQSIEDNVEKAVSGVKGENLEHFPERWAPVFRRKCDQIKNLERLPIQPNQKAL